MPLLTPPILTKAKTADTAARYAVKGLVNDNKTFNFTAGFAFSKIKVDNKDTYNFCQQVPNHLLMGLANTIKSQVTKKIKHIEQVPILLNYCRVENSHVYKPVSTISAYEYDLDHAYTTLLRNLFIDVETYEKMLKYKYVYGFNINQSIGMALLGDKIVKEYKHGKAYNEYPVINPLRGIFYMLRFLIIDSIKKLLNEHCRYGRIAYFVDAFIVQFKEEIEDVNDYFHKSLADSLIGLRNVLKKYENIELFDFFEFEQLDDVKFTFKMDYLSNVIYQRNEMNGKPILIFNRNNKILTYK